MRKSVHLWRPSEAVRQQADSSVPMRVGVWIIPICAHHVPVTDIVSGLHTAGEKRSRRADRNMGQPHIRNTDTLSTRKTGNFYS